MAYVTGIMATTLSATTLSTAPTDFTGCNFLAALVSYAGSSGPLTGFSDSKTNTWVPHPSGILTVAGGANVQLKMLYCTNPTVDAAQTFTAGLTATDAMLVSVIGLSGRSTTVESPGAAGDSSSVTSHVGGATGGQSAGDDVVAAYSDEEVAVGGRLLTYTAGSGWTLPTAARNADARVGVTGGFLYQTNVGTGSLTATWTTSGANNGAALVLAVRQAAANTQETPPAGTLNVPGNTPTVTKVTNTVLFPSVARHGSQVLEPDRRIIVPERRIFLPSRRAA